MSAPQHLALMTHRPDGTAIGSTLADASRAHLSVLDAAPTRGDGIFETLSVAAGRPQALQAHLDRFASSAQLLDLPKPTQAVWRDAIFTIAALLADEDEAWIKIVLTRGVEQGPAATGRPPEGTPPTGWVYGTASPDFTRERTDGIDVVLLDRGLRSDVATTSPLAVRRCEDLSATPSTVLRSGKPRAGEPMTRVFVSSDGLLLEGPTSTLIVRHGDALLTPPAHLGILPGTTQADVFDAAAAWGLRPATQTVRPDGLRGADGAWLVSSVRHAAPLRSVDGEELPVDRALTDRMNAMLRSRRS